MRIVLVNWARIWDGANRGGGVNGYCQSLALALQARGHEVCSLFGGTTIRPDRSDCHVVRHRDWVGIKVYEVVNSPVLAPSLVQFRDPMGEVTSPELERNIDEFFRLFGPDVVHFHNIEGFSASCVDVAKRNGAAVVFSLHNYHTLCPQVYLMQGHRIPCMSSRGGRACVDCVSEAPDIAAERQKIAGEYEEEQTPGVAEAREELGEAFGRMRREFGWPVRAMRSVRGYLRARRVLANARRGAPTIGRDDNAYDPRGVFAATDDDRGQTKAIIGDGDGGGGDEGGGPAEAAMHLPLLNVVEPEPDSGQPLNEYGRRRRAMVDMLNGCDRVLAVSDFVRRKFMSYGVEEARIETCHIGTRLTEMVEQAPELVFDPPAFKGTGDDERPVRLMFMGYNHHYKGLSMLFESLELLRPDQLSRIDLSIYALDGESIEWLFRRLEPRLASLTFRYGYEYKDIPWMLGGKDLVVVCSVWWDNAPQTVFEALACGVPVIGAEIGGIPDFVRDGENGLLFRANDRRHLADRLGEVVADPTMLNRLRANVRSPKGMGEHVLEMERLYGGLRGVGDGAGGDGAGGGGGPSLGSGLAAPRRVS